MHFSTFTLYTIADEFISANNDKLLLERYSQAVKSQTLNKLRSQCIQWEAFTDFSEKLNAITQESRVPLL
jgi:hypothetical protein